MAITLSDYPAIDSPAACPKCGSMDLTWPWCGRRTGLYLSTCRDCKTPIRSSVLFSVLERKVIRRAVRSTGDVESFQRLRDIASEERARLNARDPKLRQSREPGEEG